MKYVLIVGDSAAFEVDGVHHTEFQSIDFIKTFSRFEEAMLAGEQALDDGHDSYVIPTFYDGITTFKAKEEVTV